MRESIFDLRLARAFFLAHLILWFPFGTATGQVEIAVDAQDTGRIFEGIGAASGGGEVSRLLINYPEPQRGQILDYLFKPNYGASLQLLKVEIGGDGNSTEGSEPSHMHTEKDEDYSRGFEWWIMKEARRRNPALKLVALAWDFPAWVGKADSPAAVEYLVRYLVGMKRTHDLDIDYIGLWNETSISSDFAKRLKRALAARHLTTRIIADDLVNTWSIADAMKADKELMDSVDVVSTHYPRFLSSEVAKGIGKPIWSSEDGPWSDSWGKAGEQSAPYAELLNRNYIEGRMSSTTLWALISAYYDILDVPNAGLLRAKTPWSGHYELQSPLWIVAHTTQFAKPGWQYLDHACGLLATGGSYVTLRRGKDFSVIVESIAAVQPLKLTLRVDPELSSGRLAVWKTNRSSFFVEQEPVTPVAGKAEVTIEPDSVYSITTTTGQYKGAVEAPPASPFPMPYRDTFEGYRSGDTTPRYFIEQNGAYVTTRCAAGRHGHCLEQLVNRSPIVWTYGTTAGLLGTASIIGDQRWRNYQVSADFYLDEPGYARVLGRLSRATLDGQLNGYQLYAHSDGLWELKTAVADGVIASGRFSHPMRTWHRIGLIFRDDRIAVEIDDRQVSVVRNSKYSLGMAGLGNGWNVGQYDNFSLTPVSGSPLFAPVDSAPPSEALESPKLFVPTPMSQSVRLSWSPVPGALGYRIRFGASKDALNSSADVGALESYRVTTLTNGVKYFFAVAAYAGGVESPLSDVQEATPAGIP